MQARSEARSRHPVPVARRWTLLSGEERSVQLRLSARSRQRLFERFSERYNARIGVLRLTRLGGGITRGRPVERQRLPQREREPSRFRRNAADRRTAPIGSYFVRRRVQ